MPKYDKLVRLSVDHPRVVHTYKVKDVAFYRLTVELENEEHGVYQVVNHRRFSEFYALYDDMTREFAYDTDLVFSLPKPPMKVLPFFTNQTSPEFLHERAEGLSEFMSSLRRISAVRRVKGFWRFLGVLAKGRRETSLLFTSGSTASPPSAAEKLLMRIATTSKDSKFPAAVHSFSRDKKGRAGVAESSHELSPGDVLSRVDGDSTEGHTFHEVEAMVKLSGTPVIIHFIGANPFTPVTEAPPSSSEGSDDSESDEASRKKSKKKSKKRSKKDKDASSEEEDDDEPKSEKSGDEDEEDVGEKRKTKKKKSSSHHRKTKE